MPDILSIVSKAVFEEEAGALSVGSLWPTASYASTNKALQALSGGGSLFLVTVRPGNVLWLVAALDNPKSSRGAWRAAANTVPITDLTPHIKKIKFANGKGLVRDAKLGMSLQTPRELSAETATLFREARPTTPRDAAPVSARPDGIPDDARWDAIAELWELVEFDANGARQGMGRRWRTDGTLHSEGEYRDHEPHGVRRRFHPDGSIAVSGTWVDGLPREMTFHRAKGDTDQSPIAANAARQVEHSVDGRTIASVEHFDDAGQRVDHFGVPVPERPHAVPATARWFSVEDCWVDGRMARGTGRKIGTWRWWSTTGSLQQTERYTETGKHLSITQAGEPDKVDTVVDRFCAGDAAPPKTADQEDEMRPWSRRYDLAKVWDPILHASMRERLAKLPAAITREYLEMIYDMIESYARGWSWKAPQSKEIVDVVDDWEARAPKQTDVEAWYRLGMGARAALAIGDRERVERWWARFAKTAKPKAKDKEASDLFGDLEEQLPELKKQVAAFLGKPKATTAKMNDAAVLKAASATNGAEYLQLVRDPKTGEAWIFGQGPALYFDGKRFAPSDVIFDDTAKNDCLYVMASDACDERVVKWPGKFGWLVLQRYGRCVHWHEAKYYPSRGQPETTNLLWFKAPNPALAKRLMQLIAATNAGRPIDPWMDPKLGVIVRSYSGDGLTSLGVSGDTLTTGRRVVEKLASHEAAVRAFEAIEIERMRGGSYIERFRAVNPDKDDD